MPIHCIYTVHLPTILIVLDRSKLRGIFLFFFTVQILFPVREPQAPSAAEGADSTPAPTAVRGYTPSVNIQLVYQ